MPDFLVGIGIIIIEYLFGSVLVAGIVFFFIMVAYGIGMRFTFDCWVATMPALMYTLFFHPETRIFPGWIWGIVALVLGMIIGLAAIRIFSRR